MIKYEDECAGCREAGLPCRGIGCRNRSVKRLYCSECGESSDYKVDGSCKASLYCPSCGAKMDGGIPDEPIHDKK